MYILIDKNNKIIDIRNTIPSYYSDNLLLCEVEMLPEKYDYLVAENIHLVEDKLDDVVVNSYYTCDLIAKFRPAQTEKQIAKRNALKEIKELKQKLADTDYQAIKYVEGQLLDGEYAMMKVQRQTWRERINELENLIK